MNLVIINIFKIKKERRCLPLEIRAKMYEDVIELRKQGLTQKEIQKKIFEEYGMRLPQPTISTWINKKYHPLRKINKFDGKPSPELAYVIGTTLSDGWKRFDGKGYLLRLDVNDKEFAEEFGKCLAKLLGKDKPYKPFWNEKHKQWIVEACSVLLYRFLNKPFEELKTYIEYSKNTASAFIRALFDGEGSMHKSQRILKLHNTNIELLNYVKYLLEKYFDINATGPYLATKSGRVMQFPNGKIGKAKKDQYYLYIRANSLLNFYKYIGFTIKRKQRRLIKALNNRFPLPSFFLSF